MKNNRIFRLLLFIKPYTGMVFLSVLFSTAAITCSIGLLGTSAYLIASAALHPAIGSLQVAIVGVRVFGISRAAFRYIERLTTHSLNFRLLAEMRVWFYKKIEPLAPAKLIYHKSGDILTRAVSDIEELENFYVRVVSPPISALLITLGVTLFVGLYEPSIGLVVFSGLFITGVVLPLLIYLFVRSGGNQWVADRSEFTSELVELLQGIEDIQAFNLEEEKHRQLDKMNERYTNSGTRLAMAGNIADSSSIFINNLTIIAFLFVAIPLVLRETISGVVLTTLTFIVIASFEAVNSLSTTAQYFDNCMKAAKRLFDIVDISPETDLDGNIILRDKERIEIDFQDMRFMYPETNEITLDNINLFIGKGEHVAIIGPSGAGKSTLTNLLLRFWKYQQGSIYLNDVDLNLLDINQIRELISVCNQRSYIFNTTLRENLLLADENANEEKMKNILDRVYLTRWYQTLPDGFDTWLGEHGVKMSGGERQRLAIARALLKKSPLMIFDEPFSNLDIQNEEKIMENMRESVAGCTSIWITHHLLKMEFYSNIIVINRGQIIEAGTHESLISQNGYYANLMRMQSSEFGI